MNEEKYMVNKKMLESFYFQVFINRFEKRREELLSNSEERVMNLMQEGMDFDSALLIAAEEMVNEVWGIDTDEA